MTFQNTLAFAQQLDIQDELKNYRSEFIFPQHNEKDVIYFTGNSLGLQPKRAKKYVDDIMNDWASLAVEGHFYAEKPWWDYQERFAEPLSKIVGAKPSEVTVMNTLTVNLHLLMVSFYQPTQKRYKIICEEKAFPSDQYMLQSQIKFHGFDPKEALVEIKRREGEHTIRLEDIIEKINELENELALVLWGGVNYYTGQVFDMQAITKAGHKVGAKVGFDLAHAAGNVELKLNEWNVDFAAWCSYKYMNSGPGNASGCFVHEKHHHTNLPRFGGWWGHNKERRFKMEPDFDPILGADGWQVSNLPVLSLAPYLASVQMFAEVGMEKLIKKRNQLTAYLEFILREIDQEISGTQFEIITPRNQEERACQLSVYLHGQGRTLFDYLMANGVITDWREPNVIRLAPVPFYCSYEDMYRFGEILIQFLKQ
ncbi:kynureninase [Flavobacterium columnare]|uniref:Kynureninase n=1 Tax=Flavobacterium columnare (strain ATCC 49512 / CIP 103533 / TG 44/87) TaxID=1041826 RepID=G8X5B7_FLACA|nr:kynureninase [Flavobacterium columnare]AEW85528.1 kynureninase [Flavobacterium columnare ATCC 49512]ANO49269.1 kynureninase [Flavobacterium columnare]APT22747.1 kynureninase [Flavobacterium columnare]MBF6653302.1 kynureninase [Flavobacterium columnare]MBF6656325.1 kynureninase [Flavobacterium columnare]